MIILNDYLIFQAEDEPNDIVWIKKKDGEGGQFKTEDFEKYVDMFFKEYM